MSRALEVRESDLFILTARELNYYDAEHPHSDLYYHMTRTCEHLYGANQENASDAGRIISLEGVPMPMKDPTFPAIKSVNTLFLSLKPFQSLY